MKLFNMCASGQKPDTPGSKKDLADVMAVVDLKGGSETTKVGSISDIQHRLPLTCGPCLAHACTCKWAGFPCARVQACLASLKQPNKRACVYMHCVLKMRVSA